MNCGLVYFTEVLFHVLLLCFKCFQNYFRKLFLKAAFAWADSSIIELIFVFLSLLPNLSIQNLLFFIFLMSDEIVLTFLKQKK